MERGPGKCSHISGETEKPGEPTSSRADQTTERLGQQTSETIASLRGRQYVGREGIVITTDLLGLYNEIYALSNSLCAACEPAYHCCEAAGCEHAKSWAKGVYKTDLPEGDGLLPYLSAEGCTVPIQMRMLCTMWLCSEAKDRAPPRYRELLMSIVRAEADRWRAK